MTISSKRFLRTTIVGSALVAAALGSAAAFGLSMNDDEKKPVRPHSGVKRRAPYSNPGYWTKERMEGAKPYPMEVRQVPPQPPRDSGQPTGKPAAVPPGMAATKP
jgi:hypothetical protein